METIVLDLDNYIDIINNNFKKNNLKLLLHSFMEVLKVINSNRHTINLNCPKAESRPWQPFMY